MQKRAFKRIPASVYLSFFFENMIYTGVVTNLSENGMFINTRMCFPRNSRFEILIPLDGELLEVPVKVNRVVKTNGFYDGMGIELLNPSQNYLEFVNSLKSTS